jgi:serine/threonine protein kinase
VLVSNGKQEDQQSTMAFSLSDFSAIKKIGDGSMGTVYSAIHKSSKRKVVIKELASGLSATDSLILRLANEARAAAALVHDNIARVFDFGEEDGSFFISMEYVDGWDFEYLLQQPRPVPLAIGVMIVLQALKGLFYAHGRGAVHCDVKPGNILISRTGRVKVVDFGFAFAGTHSNEIIDPSKVYITPAYVPPEVVMGSRQQDVCMDIWSCGVLAYRILAGKFPFSSIDPTSLMFSIVHERQKDIRIASPVVPENVAGTVFDCLNKDKQLRPPTLGPLIASLENYINELGVRDVQKCVCDYLNGSFRIPPYLKGLLVRYHLRKGEALRDAGDVLGSEAHFGEVERYGGKDLLPKKWRITHEVPAEEEQPGETRQTVYLSREFLPGAIVLVVFGVLSMVGISVFIGTQRLSPPDTIASRAPVDTETSAIIAAKTQAREQIKPQEHDSALQSTVAPIDHQLTISANDTPATPPSLPRPEAAKRKRPAVLHSIERPSIQQAGAVMIGILRLSVDPPQAHVLVDGVKIPNAELSEGARLTVGSHSLAVFCDGYTTHNSTVRIERNETQALTVALKALEKGTGLLHVHSYPWAEVYVDDVDKGPCPTQQPIALSEGDHIVLVKRDGFKPYTETVHIARGEEARLKVELSR